MTQSANDNLWSTSLFRVAGYGLLAIAIFNLIDAFVPAYATDPNWKFGLVGTLIERMPVALVGFVLVLFNGADYRSRWEQLLLRVMSWLTVAAGILFLLLVPLVVKAGMEIDTQSTIQINTQYNQQMVQLEEIQAKLNSATEQEMAVLLQNLKNQNLVQRFNSPEDLKRQVATEVEQAKKLALENSQSAQGAQRLNLRKSVIKWSLSAIVSAFLFFSLWSMTRWARRPNKSWVAAPLR